MMNRSFLPLKKSISFIRRANGTRNAAYHPPTNATTAPPQPIANKGGDAVSLTWSTPDDGSSPITGFRLCRRVPGGAEALIAGPGPDVTTHTDNDAGVASYYFRVTASNGNGLGASSARVIPLISESACTGAGITVLTDASGDTLDQQPSHDIRSLQIAEPFFAGGSNKLVFTIQMSDLTGSLTRNTQWRVYFTGPDTNGYFVDMRTDLLSTASSSTALTFTTQTGRKAPLPRWAMPMQEVAMY